MRTRSRSAVAGTLLAAAILFPAVFARADPTDPYPVTSLLSSTGNPVRDAQDGKGPYDLEAGFVGSARRALQRSPGTDPATALQAASDDLLQNRPDLPGNNHWGDVGNPDYMPDWDHDGAFGDSGATDPTGMGDFDADTDGPRDTAYFPYPCARAADRWLVHYRYANGRCDATDAGGAPYALGVAREVKVTDARGLVLDATLWLPGAAVARRACPAMGTDAYASRAGWKGCAAPHNLAGRFPGVVFSNGLSSRQDHYYWFAMRMASEGFVVLTYDPAGQADSEGTWNDLFGFTESSRADCQFAGACMDTQDMVRWFAGRKIHPVPDSGPRLVARHDPLANRPNPARGILDTSRIGLAGHSMGAIGSLLYVRDLAAGAGEDGRPLPPIGAVVAYSGIGDSRAVVPIQLITSEHDGSPAFIAPEVGGADLGATGEGIGYGLIKEGYDAMRATDDPSPLDLIVLEGGVHTDEADPPFIFRSLWALALSADYGSAWMRCHLDGDAKACARAVAAKPHLSRAYASEQDPDGPAGPSPSSCITVPDAASFAQTPQDFLSAESGKPVYDCTAP